MIVRVHKCRPKMYFPILAWTIMLFQGMKPWKRDAWSHMAISYLSLTGIWKFADSTSKGVRDMPDFQFLRHYEIVDTVLININFRPEDFLRWYEEHEGKEYDSWQIVGLALKTLGFISFNKFGANYRKLICNELVLSLLVRFKGLQIGDSDNYDLNYTWDTLLGYRA